jgi:riboflavin kinase / FMN adenylyltransferase
MSMYKKIYTAITIGLFDGVHLGHQYLLGQLRAIAEKNHLKPLILTFENSLILSQNSTKTNQEIYSTSQKLDILKGLGFEVKILDFLTIKEMSPEEFITFLKLTFDLKYLVVGSDFKFAKNRLGDTDWLKRNTKKLDYKLTIVDPYLFENQKISSSLIKELIQQKDFSKVKNFLGRETIPHN